VRKRRQTKTSKGEEEEKEGEGKGGERAGLQKLGADLVLKKHGAFRRKTNAGLKDVFDASALFKEGINNGGITLNERSLKKVAEDRKNVMKRFEILRSGTLDLNTSHEFSENDEIKNDGSGKK